MGTGEAVRVLTLDDMEIRQHAFRRWFLTHEHECVYTAPEAIRLLGGPAYDIVMLDHDLAEEHYLTVSEGLSEVVLPGEPTYSPGTGMDVVDFIVAQKRADAPNAPKLVIVHSWNPTRSIEMVARLRDAGVPVWKIPFTPTLPFQLE